MRLLILALVCACCALGQKVEVESDDTVDFSKYRSFAIRDGQLNSRNPALNSELTRKRIETEIRKGLEGKGLAFVESGAADLNIRYTLGTMRKVDREAYPAGWRGRGTRIVRVPYTEGTLVIDLRDAGTRSLVWRAIAREEKDDASKLEGKLDDMVRKSFDKYPPKK
jgi:hypothetical protein